MNENLFETFRTRFPEDRLTTFIETGDGKILSYTDLETISGKMARLLLDLGVTKGDRVMVQVEKSAEAIFLYLACLRAGAVFLPLNTAYQAGEVDYFVSDAEPTVFVCTPDTEQLVSEITARNGIPNLLTLGINSDGTLVEQSQNLEPISGCVEVAADDMAAILYTSGTTGRSKGAMLSHENLRSNALTLHQVWGWQKDDVMLHALPIFHTHGLFVATNCVLANGTGMIFLTKFDIDKILTLLPRSTVYMGVPTHYVRMLGHADLNVKICSNMRLFISGSAPLLEETFTEFQSRTGHTILERCGMTESGMNTSNPLTGKRIAGTVGLPLPGVEIRICDNDGNQLPNGENGGLEIRGPNVFSGYWRMPEKTAEEFRDDGFFITGDVACIDPDTGYLSIVGRDKDMIITGGFNVYPKEIELIIDEIDGIGESAVIGLSHPDFGEAVAAVATRSNGSQTDPESVIKTVKQQLANFKVPKQVFLVDELPRNAMGKVQKNVLRDNYKDTFTS